MTGEYLHVKNWNELQHYAKRNPPWIKLYRRLLHEGDFQALTEAQQWQLVRIWLVSAEEHPGGWVPRHQSWLRRMIGTSRNIPIQLFVDQGWLTSHSAAEYASARASTDASTHASSGASLDASTHASTLLDTEVQRITKEPEPAPNRELNKAEQGSAADSITPIGDEALRLLASIKARAS